MYLTDCMIYRNAQSELNSFYFMSWFLMHVFKGRISASIVLQGRSKYADYPFT